MKIIFILVVSFFIGFHIIRFIYHFFSPEAKQEFLRKKTEKRIKADFPQYEKECRKKYNQQAESDFSVLQLKKEIEKRLLNIENEANSIFQNNIFSIRSRITLIKLEITNKQKTLNLFTQNYKKTLDDFDTKKKSLYLKKDNFYGDQQKLRNELKVVFTEKDEAYKDLNDCKDSIDAWYAESNRTPWLLGNAGKKIPNNSLFGQSFSDLDSYKYDRDEAYTNVKSCKEQIGDIKSEIDKNNESIDQVKQEIINITLNIKKCKDDRTRMYELKKDGITRASTQIEIDKFKLALKSKQSELYVQELAKKEFLFKKKQEVGIIDLENKVKVTLLKKEEFIKEFDFNINHLNRVKEHRITFFNNK